MVEAILSATLGVLAGQSEDHLFRVLLWTAATAAGLVLVADVGITRVRAWKRRRSTAALPWRDDRRELADAFDKMASEVSVYLDDRSNDFPRINGSD